MQYLILDRIGPMENGERAGTYLEAGEIAPAEWFRTENISLLEAAQVLRAATDEEILNAAQAAGSADAENDLGARSGADAESAADPMARRKRAAKKSLTEDDDGTHNRNGD